MYLPPPPISTLFDVGAVADPSRRHTAYGNRYNRCRAVASGLMFWETVIELITHLHTLSSALSSRFLALWSHVESRWKGGNGEKLPSEINSLLLIVRLFKGLNPPLLYSANKSMYCINVLVIHRFHLPLNLSSSPTFVQHYINKNCSFESFNEIFLVQNGFCILCDSATLSVQYVRRCIYLLCQRIGLWSRSSPWFYQYSLFSLYIEK